MPARVSNFALPDMYPAKYHTLVITMLMATGYQYNVPMPRDRVAGSCGGKQELEREGWPTFKDLIESAISSGIITQMEKRRGDDVMLTWITLNKPPAALSSTDTMPLKPVASPVTNAQGVGALLG